MRNDKMEKNLKSAQGWVSMVLSCSTAANATIGLVLLGLGFLFTSTLGIVAGILALTFALVNFMVKHIICRFLVS